METSIFQILNLKRCDSVYYRNAAMFKTAHREVALDYKNSIEALLGVYKLKGETKDVIEGFLILEQLLAEVEGVTTDTAPEHIESVRDSFNSRRACHPTYAGKTITKSAAKRAIIMGAA